MHTNNSIKQTPSNSTFIKEMTISPTNNGALDHLTFAVKDVIDIRGEKISCGNPTWLEMQSPSIKHAPCVETLLANGATCLGRTVLGEFNSGTTGVNHFYGMPPNPKSPERVPGGSSSGSASAVAAGEVDFALGTDVAGSVRIPASFCGIYGMRPSYNSITMEGIKSFSPGFDTVGIFANDLYVLEKVYSVLSGEKSKHVESCKSFYVIEDLMLLIPDEQRQIIYTFITESCDVLNVKPIYIKLSDIHPTAGDADIGISAIFRKLFCSEIWDSLGDWLKQNNILYQKSTYVDFSYMEKISKTDLSNEKKLHQTYSDLLRILLADDALICIPTSPDVAPLRNNTYTKVNEFDYEKLRPLISLASVGGLPQINQPIKSLGSVPLGVSLLAGHGNDLFLIHACKIINENKLSNNLMNKLM
jgi:amidase